MRRQEDETYVYVQQEQWSNGKEYCNHSRKEVTDKDINDLSTQILTAFCYILNKAEDADKDVYDKMMARRSQELIDDITEIIEDRR